MERMYTNLMRKRERETTDLDQATYKKLQKDPVIDVVRIVSHAELKIIRRSASTDDLTSLQPHDLDSSPTGQDEQWSRMRNAINDTKEALERQIERDEKCYKDAQKALKEYTSVFCAEYQYIKEIQSIIKKSQIIMKRVIMKHDPPFPDRLFFILSKTEELRDVYDRYILESKILHEFYVKDMENELDRIKQNIDEKSKEVENFRKNYICSEDSKYDLKVIYEGKKRKLQVLKDKVKTLDKHQRKGKEEEIKNANIVMRVSEVIYEREHPEGRLQRAEKYLKVKQDAISKLKKQTDKLKHSIENYKESHRIKQERYKNVLPKLKMKKLILELRQAKVEKNRLAKYCELIKIIDRKRDLERSIELYETMQKKSESKLKEQNKTIGYIDNTLRDINKNFNNTDLDITAVKNIITDYKAQIYKLEQGDYKLLETDNIIFKREDTEFLNDNFRKLSSSKQTLDDIPTETSDKVDGCIETRNYIFQIFRKSLIYKNINKQYRTYEDNNQLEITSEQIKTIEDKLKKLGSNFNDIDNRLNSEIESINKLLTPLINENLMNFLGRRCSWSKNTHFANEAMESLKSHHSIGIQENMSKLHEIASKSYGTFYRNCYAYKMVEKHYQSVLTEGKKIEIVEGEYKRARSTEFNKITELERKVSSKNVICNKVPNLINLFDQLIQLKQEILTLSRKVHEYYSKKFENERTAFIKSLNERIDQKKQELLLLTASKTSQTQAKKSLKEEIKKMKE